MVDKKSNSEKRRDDLIKDGEKYILMRQEAEREAEAKYAPIIADLKASLGLRDIFNGILRTELENINEAHEADIDELSAVQWRYLTGIIVLAVMAGVLFAFDLHDLILLFV